MADSEVSQACTWLTVKSVRRVHGCVLLQFGGNDVLQVYNVQQVKHRLTTTGMYIASCKVRPPTPTPPSPPPRICPHYMSVSVCPSPLFCLHYRCQSVSVCPSPLF